MKKVRIGIIGLGHWGPNLVRSFFDDPRCEVKSLCDQDPKRLELISSLYPSIQLSTDSKTLFHNPEIDAVVIATPTCTHFDLAKEALLCGKHVLVEKPLTTKSAEGKLLSELAVQHGLRLMVGHVFLFNSGIHYVNELIKNGELGEIVYAYATRVNLGPIRRDVNALWDLAPHDISIFNYWLGGLPLTAQATGLSYVQPGVEDVVFTTLTYPKNIVVNLHVGWLDPRKTRQTVVVGTKKMVVFDDLHSLGPVQIYDKRVSLGERQENIPDSVQSFKAVIQEGTLSIPKISLGEPLKKECHAFITSIINSNTTISDAEMGIGVVEVLEAASTSLSLNGARVNIRPDVSGKLSTNNSAHTFEPSRKKSGELNR